MGTISRTYLAADTLQIFTEFHSERPNGQDDPGVNLITHLLTYLLTAWCRVLFEKLTGLQLVKEFPAFHGTRRFITALTSVLHLSLSWGSPVQSIYPHPTSWRSILVYPPIYTQVSPVVSFPPVSPTKTLYTPTPHPYAPHVQPISFFSILSPAQYWVRSTNHIALRYAISSIPPLPRPSQVQILSSTTCRLKHITTLNVAHDKNVLTVLYFFTSKCIMFV